MATPIENNTEALWELLETAQTLPAVNEIKAARGTCTGDDATGYVEVELGFKPDIVMLTDMTYNDQQDSSIIYSQSVVMWFKELVGKGYTYYEVHAMLDGINHMVFFFEQTATGFRITECWLEELSGWDYHPNFTMNYMAVKYTP